MKPRFVWLAIALLAVVLGVYVLRPFDRSVAALTMSYGYVETGEKFGVRVATASPDAVSAALVRGWIRADPEMETFINTQQWRCGGRPRREGDIMLVLFDKSWRRGTLCLYERDQEIVAIGWTFAPIELP